MSAITIEFAQKTVGSPCTCCGGRTTRLTRYVYQNGDAHAIYYCDFSDNHPDRCASAIISIGEWGEGSQPSQRNAFAVRIGLKDEAWQVSVTDANTSPWADAEILGTKLTREEALKHMRIKEVFQITDHMVIEDMDLLNYFE